MSTRTQKVKELLESFKALKRHGTFRSIGPTTMPRITPSQWGALLLVEEFGEGTVKDVAGALGITSSAATQLIDALVTNGYVIRQTNIKDRRTVQLVLSKKTKLQVERMKKKVLQKFLELFEVLDDKEFNQYLLLNKKIVERFSKK